MSVHLLNSDGTEIQVNGPICVTIPLPANSRLKHDDALPAWKFDKKIGKQSKKFLSKFWTLKKSTTSLFQHVHCRDDLGDK